MEQIKHFLFNEKVFSINVKRCFITRQHSQFLKVNEDIIANMILSLVINFTTTLIKESGNNYIHVNEGEIESSRLSFYILDGNPTIQAHKEIVDNDKYKSLEDIYWFHKARLLHKDFPPRFITNLCSHQNPFIKQYVDMPFFDQVTKAKEKWIYSGRPNFPGKGHVGT